MKKKLIIPLLVMVLVTMSCSVFGGSNSPTAEVVLPTQEPEQVVEMPTAIPPTEVPPTPIPVEPTAVQMEEPTAEPLAPQAAEPTWETWVAAGDASKQFVEINNGVLAFDLPSAETYAYADRTDSVYQDVFVQAQVETYKGSANGLSVICRASDRGWYELRIATINSANRPYAGSYELYRYDYSLKAQGKNPYVNLLKNISRVNSVDIVNGTNYNTIGLMCDGDQIRPFINGVEQFPNKQQIFDNVLTVGTVGVGAMSFGEGAVQINVYDLSIQSQ